MIRYKCACGKVYRVPDENAGHKFTCPACGRVGVVEAGKTPLPAGASRTPSTPAPAKPGPVGVYGCLLFFCVCLIIFGPLYFVGQGVSHWELAEPVFIRFPSLKTAMCFETFGFALILVYGVMVGCKILRGDPSGKRLAKRYLLTRFFGGRGIEVITLFLMLRLPDQMLCDAIHGTIVGSFVEGVFFAIWWLYFMKSKRVRNTYED